MPMIGRADNDGVYIFALQNLSVVAGGVDILAIGFAHALQPPVIAITGSHQLGQPGRDGTAGIGLSHATAADERDLDFVVG